MNITNTIIGKGVYCGITNLGNSTYDTEAILAGTYPLSAVGSINQSIYQSIYLSIRTPFLFSLFLYLRSTLIVLALFFLTLTFTGGTIPSCPSHG